MTDSICIIKKDGINYNFTHRSFQEYFAAYCIARVASRNLEGLFSKFSRRYEDNVLPMVYDINPDLFREKYIIPFSKKYKAFLERKSSRGDFERMMQLLGAAFIIRIRDADLPSSRRKSQNGGQNHKRTQVRRRAIIDLNFEGEFESFYKSIKKISKFKNELYSESDRSDDDKFCDYLKEKYKKDTNIYIKSDGNSIIFLEDGVDVSSDEMRGMFTRTGMYRYICGEAEMLRKTTKYESGMYKTVSDSFSDLF